MAAAAASISARPVLPSGLRAIRKTRAHPALFAQLPETKLLALKPLLLSVLSRSPSLRRRPLRSPSAASFFTETDDDGEEQEAVALEEAPEDESEQPPPTWSAPPPPPGEEGRLYVGNLPYTMTPAQLAEVFGQAGTVDSVEVVYDRVTDRSRGFAFVTMASTEDAHAAIKMFDGAQLGGRTVKVNFPEVPRGGEREVVGPRARAGSRGYVDTPHKVYAGNLGWKVTSESLKEAFAKQPGLLGAKVLYDRDSGRSRGFGFVSFASSEEAEDAIEAMNGVELEGRPLRLSPALARNAMAPAEARSF